MLCIYGVSKLWSHYAASNRVLLIGIEDENIAVFQFLQQNSMHVID